MDNGWIFVTGWSGNWSGQSLSIHPGKRIAKISHSEFSGSFDDEGLPEYDETETLITIEEALARVYPHEELMATIFRHIPGDYSGILKSLIKRRN